jgi:hypothetical protein
MFCFIEQILSDDRVSKIASGISNKSAAGEILPGSAEYHFIRSPSRERLKQGIPHECVPDLILRDIGECNILFKDWSMSGPFRVAMAEDELIIRHGKDE